VNQLIEQEVALSFPKDDNKSRQAEYGRLTALPGAGPDVRKLSGTQADSSYGRHRKQTRALS
jgi:hypothetical protein